MPSRYFSIFTGVMMSSTAAGFPSAGPCQTLPPKVVMLFRRLAEQFEYCVHGLNRVKSDLEVLREEQYQVWKKNLLDA